MSPSADDPSACAAASVGSSSARTVPARRRCSRSWAPTSGRRSDASRSWAMRSERSMR